MSATFDRTKWRLLDDDERVQTGDIVIAPGFAQWVSGTLVGATALSAAGPRGRVARPPCECCESCGQALPEQW